MVAEQYEDSAVDRFVLFCCLCCSSVDRSLIVFVFVDVVFVAVVVVVFVDFHDFCTYLTTYSPTFLFLMVAEQYEDSAVFNVCAIIVVVVQILLLFLLFLLLLSKSMTSALTRLPTR
jgi:hypothetical protein